MDWVGAIIAGLAGTAAMSLLIYAGPLLGMPKIGLIGLLGSMVSGNKTAAAILGTLLHMAVGVASGMIYALLWNFGILSPTWFAGLLFGLGHGVVVSILMPRVLMMHPRNPTMERSLIWVIGLLLAHLVYGVTTALTHGSFLS